MEKIELTEEELQAKIDEAVKKVSEELEKKHDSQMAKLRTDNKAKVEEAVKKAVEESKLTQEELAKKQLDEQMKEKNERLAFLEEEFKKSKIQQKLTESGLPTMFVNDTRLLNAKEEDLDKVIEDVKTEFSKVAPQGSGINTNITIGAQNGNTQRDPQFEKWGKLM